MLSLTNLLNELEAAKSELVAAQAHYVEASNAVSTAKFNLEFRKAEKLAEGVEGKNAEAREATLRLELAESEALKEVA